MARLIARVNYAGSDSLVGLQETKEVAWCGESGRTIALHDGPLPKGWTEDMKDCELAYASRMGWVSLSDVM